MPATAAYALSILAALVPWTTFCRAVTGAAQSMESNAQLHQQVYFPRLSCRAPGWCGRFVDYAIAWLLLNIVALVLHHGRCSYSAHTVLIVIQAAIALGWGCSSPR